MTDQKKHSPQRLAAVLLALVLVVMAVLPASRFCFVLIAFQINSFGVKIT